MKTFVLTVAALLAMVAQSASAADPAFNHERDSAVMLYFSKSFGSDQPRNRSPLAFGLRLQQQSRYNDIGPVSLLEARYSLDGRRQFLVAGLNAFGSEESSDESSSASGDMAAKHPGWTAAMIIGAVLVGWCIVDACKSDDDDPETSTDTSNGT